jgi:hypothetical protein
MDPPAAKLSLHPAVQRLLLVASAAAVLLALGWAALRILELETEVRTLQQDLAASRRAERASGAAARAIPVVDHDGARVAELQRRVTAAETQHKQTAEKAAAREKELDGVIAFLRKEIEAAQQTIERLSSLPPEPPPANPQPSPNFRDPVRRQP